MATWNKHNLLGHKSLMNQATTNLGVKTPKMPNIEREIKIKQPRVEKGGKMAAWNKCPGCGITISGAPDYCPNCAEPWTIECPNCGITWRFWEFPKFCPNCGAPAQRRGVTRGKRGQVAPEVGKPRVAS